MSRSRIRRNQRRARRSIVRTLMLPRLTAPLMAAWEHGCWALEQVFLLFVTPADLAGRELILRTEHRTLADLIRNLEYLAQRIVLAGAMLMNLILKPLRLHPRQPKRRRKILIWPDKPERWPARLAILAPRGAEEYYSYLRNKNPSRFVASLPLARRLEAVRRVLGDPQAHIRRFAIRLARLAQANRRANSPRLIDVHPWQSSSIPTRGERLIATAMPAIQRLSENQILRWNQACEPG